MVAKAKPRLTAAQQKASELANLVNNALGTSAVTIASHRPPMTVIPTGSLPFDKLLGGGMPRGRMVEVYGAPSSLKSYLGMCALRGSLAMGLEAVLIDTERTFDASWAETMGIDTTRLLVSQPATGEEALDIVEAMVTSKQVGMIVVDSVSAMLPQAYQVERLAGKQTQPGRLAALMSRALPKITTANTDTSILWINQLREQVGITFGASEKPTGGRSLPFYASIRINIKGTGKINEEMKVHNGEEWTKANQQVAQKWKAVTEKNKLGAPHQEVHFTWKFKDGGIDEVGFLAAQAIETGLVTNVGQMWDWHVGSAAVKAKRIRGIKGVRGAIEVDPVLRDAIRLHVLSASPGPVPVPSNEAETKSDENSASEVPVNTRGPARAASGSTVPLKKKVIKRPSSTR